MWPADAIATNDPVSAAFLNSAPRLIDSTTLGSATPTVTYSDIPPRYRHLLVMFELRGASAALNVNARVNGDTSALYGQAGIHVSGSSLLTDVDDTNGTSWLVGGMGNDSVGDGPGAGWITFHDYAATDRHKMITAKCVAAEGVGVVGPSDLYHITGWYRSKDAVTSITLGNTGGNNLAVGSRFALYALGAK